MRRESSYWASHRIRQATQPQLARKRGIRVPTGPQLPKLRQAELRRKGHPTEAIVSYRKALGIERSLVERFPDEAENLNDLARTHENIGLILL